MDERRGRGGMRRGAAMAGTLLAGAVLGAVVLAAVGHAAGQRAWERMTALLTGRTTQFDVSSPAVVEKIRQLARLETVEYSLDKIVEADKENAYLPGFLAGDKLLLVAHGEVIAGVDLGQMKAGDVAVKGDAVRVKLPAAQILTTRLDNARTRVYSRTTGLLVTADPNLETQTRQQAEQQIGQAALDDGILSKAQTNARASVTVLLYGLGFRSVSVE